MWEAVWNDTVVAAAAHVTRLGGQKFFPTGSVRWDLVREAAIRPGPRRLGPETAFDVVGHDRVAHHGAWCYRDPAPEFLNIKNLITFGPDVAVLPAKRPAPVRRPRRWWTALFKSFAGHGGHAGPVACPARLSGTGRPG